jgi:hypothetical protein
MRVRSWVLVFIAMTAQAQNVYTHAGIAQNGPVFEYHCSNGQIIASTVHYSGKWHVTAFWPNGNPYPSDYLLDNLVLAKRVMEGAARNCPASPQKKPTATKQ